MRRLADRWNTISLRWVCLVGSASLLVSEAQVCAQFIPRSASGNFIYDVGRVGNTTVDQNSRYLGLGGSRWGGGTAAAGNFLGADAAGGAFFGGRLRGAGGGASFGGGAPGGWMVLPAGGGSFARPFAAPPRTGEALFTVAAAPPVLRDDARNESLLERIRLTEQMGLTGPVRDREGVRQIRDETSWTSLRNAPSPIRENDGGERRSYSQILGEQLAAQHRRAVTEAWTWFREGNYGKALRGFETAEVTGRDDPEPAVGMIWAAMANDSQALAHVVFMRLMRNETPVFGLPIDVRNKHTDPEFIASIVTQLGRAARQNPDNVEMAALSVFLCWFSGQQDEALRLADQIRDEHRTSTFASLAAQMRAARAAKPPDGPGTEGEVLPPTARGDRSP
jgi:hypothetical protein